MKLLLSIFLLCFTSVTHAADELTVNVQANENQFQIILPSNPSTGYQWVLSQYDKDLLTLISSNYTANKTNLIGSGGIMSFKFKLINGVKRPSNTLLSFQYSRPWEEAKGTLKNVNVIFK